MRTHLLRLLGWHLCFCVLYYWLRELLDDRSWAAVRAFFGAELGYSVVGFLIFYVYALVPYLVLRRFYGRAWYVLTGALFAGSIVAAGVRYVLEEVLGPIVVGFSNYPPGTSLLTYYLDNLFYLILHGLVGGVFFFMQETARRESEKQALVVEKQRTELAFLRGQINPHFLFNTLNNVYSLLFVGSDRAPKILERLTTLLRYSLYERAERVPLERELDYLLNLIELERLRLDHPLDLDLQLPPPDVHGRLVPPLLLVTFLENAFKHGDLMQPLEVHLSVESDTLRYVVKNTLHPQKQKDDVGGIGMENLRRRLGLLFPKRHLLVAKMAEGMFVAVLEIPLVR